MSRRGGVDHRASWDTPAPPDQKLRDPDAIHILLVEDNPGDALLTQDALADAGFEAPVTVGTVTAALSAIADMIVDLVLLDLGLPDADGIDALQRVLAAVSVPVIVLTGADSDMGVAAVKAGAQDYLRKGTFNADRLAISVALARERHDSRLLLATRAAALGRANERLSRFVAVVAHDLRSPLISAEQWTKLALSGQVPDMDDALARIMSNLDNQFKLIDNLLAVYRDHELEVTDVDPAVVLAQLTADLDDPSVVEIVGELPLVRAAPESLASVLSNLLRNAMAHATVPDRRLRLRVSARQLDQEVLLRLDDNGPGIAVEDRLAVFDRGHTTSTLHHPLAGEDVLSGYGLGLAGARDTIEAMCGLLWVEDGLIGGAGFVLALPSADGGRTAPPARR